MYSEMRKKNAFKKQILKEKRKTKNLDTHEVFQRKEKKWMNTASVTKNSLKWHPR